MQLPVVVLVRPQMGENIGAVARAMKNFGLCELRIVAPRDGWPNPKAVEMAAHGEDIIAAAQLFDDVPAAVADCVWVAASTARPREGNKPAGSPEEMLPLMRAHATAGRRTALLFGPERAGLTNEDLALVDAIVTIPTAPDAASLNIAQAAVVLGYAWFTTAAAAENARATDEPAPKAMLETFFRQLEVQLDAANFWITPEKKERMWLNMRSYFTRSAPTAAEAQTLIGLLKALTKTVV